MGPVANALLLGITALNWDILVRVFGTDILVVWCVFNLLVAVGNLWPRRFARAGQVHQSDGMRLLKIPFLKSTELEIFRTSPDLIAAAVHYDAREYSKAREAAIRGRIRSPHDHQLALILSACQLQLGEFSEAKVLLESVPEPAECTVSAVIWNNLALALWLSAPTSMEAIAHAEVLTGRSFSSYPCVLAYRSTRALVLVAAGRASEALAILHYSNYERGSATSREEQELARAFAFKQLHRLDEYARALAAARRLRRRECVPLNSILESLITADRDGVPGFPKP